MTRAALLLFALACALGAGALAGSVGRRALERAARPPPRRRPPALQTALRAWEGGEEAQAAAALGALPARLDEEDEAEADLLRALVRGPGGGDLLLEVARAHEGTQAAARALWLLVERAPDAETRRRRRADFARRWPHAWVLAPGAR